MIIQPRILLFVLAACLLASAGAHAVSTRYFSLDSAQVLSGGKLEGTAVRSSGVVVPSVETKRLSLEGTAIARSLLVLADGSAYVGSGNNGVIWKLTGDKLSAFADTEELLVNALAIDDAGTLYAGTMPKGRVLVLDRQGKTQRQIALPGAEHVWALSRDEKHKRTYAATGPEGKVFAIDDQGAAEVYYDAQASHVMALALADDGALYAGTSDDALLLRITAKDRAEVVFDFEGNEVTAIALSGKQLAVAANLFPRAPATKKDEPQKDDQKSADKTEAPKDAQKPGKGQLWVVKPGERARKLFSSDNGHLTAVQFAEEDGAVYAATGKDGQIYRVEPSGESALWIDVDERQVLALELRAKAPMFVTADAGAVYRVIPGPTRNALWTSKVLDAQFLSRFGELTFRGRGKLSFQTRSGNVEKPDATWSQWSSPLEKPGPVRSPAARFLQIRARLGTEQPSELYALTAYYLPLNQQAVVTEVTIKPKTKSGKDGEPTTLYGLEWKAENPDGDTLRYRVSFRPEAEATTRPIVRDSEVLTKTSYDFETESIPDGYYRVLVEASDELDSPAYAVTLASKESEPFLVDNRRPRVEGLRYENGRLHGVARDEQGPITKLEHAVDGKDPRPFNPLDDLLDTASESFALELPKLPAGRHVIAIHATDARSNRGTAELWIDVK